MLYNFLKEKSSQAACRVGKEFSGRNIVMVDRTSFSIYCGIMPHIPSEKKAGIMDLITDKEKNSWRLSGA